MNFKYIKAAELVEYANSAVISKSETLPITPWRAKSQSVNPFIKKDDVLLITAEDEEGTIRGYIGILPFPHPKNTDRRIYFNTCWWAHPRAGSAVSMGLFARFLQTVDQRVVFSDLTPGTAGILRSMKTFHIQSRDGMIIRIRSGFAPRLAKKSNLPFYLKILFHSRFFSFLDHIRNILFNQRIKIFTAKNFPGAGIRISEYIEDKHYHFMMKHMGSYFTIPTDEQLTWWKDYPWLVKKTSERIPVGKRYFFSAFAEQNDLFMVEFSLENKIIGIAFISIRDGVAKTQYLFYEDSQQELFFCSLIYYLLNETKVHTIVTFHESFDNYLNTIRFPYISASPQTRYTGYSETLTDELQGRNQLQDGDGDYIFT